MSRKKYEEVDESFFHFPWDRETPKELREKLAVLCNEKKRHLIDMNTEELQTWVKPIWESCGITWLEVPDT